MEAHNRISNTELREYLKPRFPEYMIPSAFVKLRNLPLTPNGKINRQALPLPEVDDYVAQLYERPRGEIEAVLSAICAELLGRKYVGRNDNFFELGGHSLLAVRLVHIAEKQTGMRCSSLSDFLRTPTIESLHKTMTNQIDEDFFANIESQVERGPIWKATENLAGGLESDYLQPNSKNNIVLSFRVNGKINRSILETAWHALQSEHPILHSTFSRSESGEWFVHENVKSSKIEIEYETGDPQILSNRLEKVLINYSTGPISRLILVDFAGDEYLSLFIQRIICDGWSLPLLLDRLAYWYREFCSGSNKTPIASMSFRRYAAFERSSKTLQLFAKSEEYWGKKLSGISLMTQFPRDSRPVTHDLCSTSFTVSKQSLNLGGITGFSIVSTITALAVALLVKCENITVASPLANRELHFITDAIGYFNNYGIIIHEFTAKKSLLHILQASQEQMIEAIKNQSLSITRLRQKFSDPRLFPNIIHTHLAFITPPMDFGNIQLTQLENTPASKTDFTVRSGETTDAIYFKIVMAPDIAAACKTELDRIIENIINRFSTCLDKTYAELLVEFSTNA
jgi:hypothetical protein